MLRCGDKTLSTSASRTCKSSKQIYKNCRPYNRGRLKIETVDADIPVKLSYYTLSYSDDCLGYGRAFVSETCDGSWHRYSTLYDCVPNEILPRTVMKDWRVLCHGKPGLIEHLPCPKVFLQSIFALLSKCEELMSGEINKVCDARRIYFPICSVDESYGGKCFSYTHFSMPCLIFQSVMEMAGPDESNQNDHGGYAPISQNSRRSK